MELWAKPSDLSRTAEHSKNMFASPLLEPDQPAELHLDSFSDSVSPYGHLSPINKFVSHLSYRRTSPQYRNGELQSSIKITTELAMSP